MSQPESLLIAGCLQYLRLRGIPAWRNNTGAMRSTYKGRRRVVHFGHVGSSDILGVLPWTGQMLCVECKVGRNKPTRDQARFLTEIREARGVAEVVRSVDELHMVIEREQGRAPASGQRSER